MSAALINTPDKAAPLSLFTTTEVTVVDRPCGGGGGGGGYGRSLADKRKHGKTTTLIKQLKEAKRKGVEDECYLVVVPELSEIDRFKAELGDWIEAPQVGPSLFAEEDNLQEGTYSTKLDAIRDLLYNRSNVITTHVMYKRLGEFSDYLPFYHVIVDEVPLTAEVLDNSIGKGVWSTVMESTNSNEGYISVNPINNKLEATAKWHRESSNYIGGNGTADARVKSFMDKVIYKNVHYVSDTFFIIPIPDIFFTKPKSLTILTFLFEGTQLHKYMHKRGFKYRLDVDEAVVGEANEGTEA